MYIRQLYAADGAIFQALRLQALRDAPDAFASSYEEECDTPLSVIGERLSKSDRGVFGAFAAEGAELAGIIGVGRERLRSMAHKAYLWTMYVSPNFRGRGLGKVLLLNALQFADALPGVRQINLSVNAANRSAISLYRTCGFKEFGREKDATLLNGVLQEDLHMVRFINEI
ncbi:MAG: GNAT family N-acetyltransferase [Gammaproteobacteria bacterium]|nr:GNAT family N-acetyltransferase [Gammaproteobacteria bacterium]